MAATLIALREFGPTLGRPEVDTLKDSKFANMKELRFRAAGGVWRVAFAFDPERDAILLVAGDKSGGSEKRFYRELIRKADERFDTHLAHLKVTPKTGRCSIPRRPASWRPPNAISSIGPAAPAA